MKAYKVKMTFDKEVLRYYPVSELNIEVVTGTEEKAISKSERLVPLGMLYYIKDSQVEAM